MRIVKSITVCIAGAVGLMASIPQPDAVSNLSTWWVSFGLPPIDGLFTPAIDKWVLAVCVAGVAGLIVPWKNVWPVLWKWIQAAMPVPLRSDTPKNENAGPYPAILDKSSLRQQVQELRSQTLAVMASDGQAIGNVEHAFILGVVDNMNILRAKLDRHRYKVPDRCKATPGSIKVWHDFLQELLETEDFDQQNSLRLNIDDYSEYHNYLLYEAACLWVGVRPHHPVTHLKAEIKLGQLKSAIRAGQLQCHWRNALGDFMAFLAGKPIENRDPSDHQPVGPVSLRRYADSRGDVPEFLRHVQVPVELPPAEENGGDAAKDITPPATESGAGDNCDETPRQ